MTKRRALLLGATGLVGREILQLLLDDDSVERVTILVRRATGTTHPKLDERIGELTAMDQQPDAFDVDEIYCALGTTIAKAGSEEKFRIVDYDIPLRAAQLGRERGATHYLLVSALGADAKSRIFYNRVKGELEESLKALAYPSLTIARPSLLLGDRAEYRRGEEIAKRFAWLMPPKYKPIEARTVARALVHAAAQPQPGAKILESREMRRAHG